MKVLRSRLLEAEIEKQNQLVSQKRKLMVGSGDRSDKIRTYNFPQNRLTDHRIGLTMYNQSGINIHYRNFRPTRKNCFNTPD